jgi:hypothetical protein
VFTDIGPNQISLLYRSVSPWEMVNILETRQVRGRGGRFASDDRAGPDCHVWFGNAIKPIIHSGEDYVRYTQTIGLWEPLTDALDQLYDITREVYPQVRTFQEKMAKEWLSRDERAEFQRLIKIEATVGALERKLRDAYRNAIYALAKQARASAAKLPVTSYVIVLQSMPGGTMYSSRDSRQGDATEVCFPLSAANALYDHIEAVELVKYREGGGYDIVGHVFADELDRMKIKLPAVRKATADAALNAFERMKPKLRDWIDV